MPLSWTGGAAARCTAPWSRRGISGWVAGNTRLSAKGLFFPQREVLLRFAGSTLTEETLPKGSVVVFGVRPCDARSLTWLDGVFCGGGQEDPYFGERRRNAVVISMACDRALRDLLLHVCWRKPLWDRRRGPACKRDRRGGGAPLRGRH